MKVAHMVAHILARSACVMALSTPVLAQQAASTGEEDMAEVVVTASRVGRSGFSAPTPTTVLDQELVQARGATNVAEVINEIPSFRPSQTPAAGARGGATSGGSFLDLRGLNVLTGAGGNQVARTLVLLDGRRVVPSNAAGMVDINMIPSALIGRTEVVTGGASAAWGSDAIAGVVNLMIRDDIEGLIGGMSYGQSAQDDNEEVSANIAGGFQFAGGRGKMVGGIEYTDNKGIPDGFISRGWGREGWGNLVRSGTRPAGVPVNNILPDLRFSDVAAPGGVIVGGPLDNTEFTGGQGTRIFTPGTVGGNQMQGGGANNSNAGIYFIGGSNLINPIKRTSAFGRLGFDFTDELNGFLELSYAESEFNGYSASRRDTPAALVVQRDNPYLPTSVRNQMTTLNLTTISVGRLAYDDQFGFDYYDNRTEQDIKRIATGLRGQAFGDWNWDAYHQYGQNHFIQHNQSTLVSNYLSSANARPGPNGTIICGAVTAANIATFGNPDPGCVPYNIFGVNQGSQAAVDYFLGVGVNDVTTQQNVSAVNLNGSLLALPAGELSIATGIEFRREEVSSTVDANSAARRFDLNNYQPISGKYTALDVYLETVVPLLSGQTLANLLEVNAAVRHTDYSTSGGVTTWKAGLSWEPVADLRFRASKSRDIRAANLQELFSTAVQARVTVTAPTTIAGAPLGFSAQVNTINQGNPLLTPEEADTLTAGVVWSPRGISGFRASVDYFDIEMDNVIALLSAQQVWDRCVAGFTALCANITTNASGAPTQIVTSRFNASAAKTSGVDIEMAYALPANFGVPGQLQLRGFATYVDTYSLSDPAGTVDTVKQTVPQWSANLSLGYRLNRFGANTTIRWLDKTLQDATLIGPGQPGYSPTLPNSINDNIRPNIFYFNVSANYEIVKRDGLSLELFGVVNNLLDKDPPHFAGSNPVGASLYDLVGRSYKLALRAKF
jgi:iron complex outermembrane recepter protein